MDSQLNHVVQEKASLIPPYGGRLVSLVVSEGEASEPAAYRRGEAKRTVLSEIMK